MSRYRSELQQSAGAVIWRLTLPLVIGVCLMLAMAPVVRDLAHAMQGTVTTVHCLLATSKNC